MNKIIKNTLILTIITVVSGLLLGIVYDITKEPIAAAQENSKQEAYRTVLPDAASLKIMKNLTRRMQRRLSETTGILTTSQKLLQGNRTAAKPWDMC